MAPTPDSATRALAINVLGIAFTFYWLEPAFRNCAECQCSFLPGRDWSIHRNGRPQKEGLRNPGRLTPGSYRARHHSVVPLVHHICGWTAGHSWCGIVS